MVEVEVRARDEVDRFDPEAGRGEVVQELITQMRHGVETGDGPVAQARVDHDGLAHRLDDERMDRQRHHAVVVDEVRLQPVRVRGDDLFGIGTGEHSRRVDRSHVLSHQRDAHVAHLPLHVRPLWSRPRDC